MNPSKTADQRFLAKWEASGALSSTGKPKQYFKNPQAEKVGLNCYYDATIADAVWGRDFPTKSYAPDSLVMHFHWTGADTMVAFEGSNVINRLMRAYSTSTPEGFKGQKADVLYNRMGRCVGLEK